MAAARRRSGGADLTGLDVFDAAGALQDPHLNGRLETQSSTTVPEKRVVTQRPPPGTKVQEGSVVAVVFSSGA